MEKRIKGKIVDIKDQSTKDFLITEKTRIFHIGTIMLIIKMMNQKRFWRETE